MRNGLIALTALLLACASAAPPPGGPEDQLAPLLLRVTPDTNAVNVRSKVASFYFDETINDRGTGAQEVDAFFLISPSDGRPRVSWHRSRIDVRPRNGFRANTAYTVALLPGLGDLRGNVMKTGASVVFSTGASIPTERIAGIVFDWPAERVAPRAYIEAVTPDSIVYLAQSDSGGKFNVGPLPAGSYLLRAILDANGNRALDRNEAYDTLRVAVPQASPAELLAAPRDTLPARVLTVAVIDSVTLRVTFDRLVAPDRQTAREAFLIQGADSVTVPIAWVRSPKEEADMARSGARAAADSSRRADSVAGRPLPPSPPAQPAVAIGTPGRTTIAAAAAPMPRLPPPFNTVTIRVARPLAPNTPYRLRVVGVRALSGRESASERTFTTPRPAPPRAAADSAAAVGPASAPTREPAPAPVPVPVPRPPR